MSKKNRVLKRFRFSASLAVGIALSLLAPTFADSTVENPLQAAVNLINSDPTKAEAILKASDKPTAYAYLAYLYMTNKVPIQNRSTTIDSLMNKAIHSKDIDDGFALGPITAEGNKLIHYEDLAMLLEHLRFISDASIRTAPHVPCFIFKDHPREAFKAFDSYWGSSRDGFFASDCNEQEGVDKIPSVSRLIELNKEILGDPGSYCTGTIRNAHFRRMAMSELRASWAPKIFLDGKSQEEVYGGSDPLISEFLEHWSNQEIWNKTKYRSWQKSFSEAESDLATHYVKNFALSEADAKKCANVALWHITSVCLGIFSGETLKEHTAGLVYKCFSKETLDLEQMKSTLAEHKLTVEESTQALSLAILNNARTEVIEELLKQRATLNPDIVVTGYGYEVTEPPLFSAVLRPDVVKALLKRGAEVNTKNMVGKTALIQAIQFNAFDTVKLLLAAGANVKVSMIPADGDDATAANESCFYNYTIGSRTPLMYACAFANSSIINSLLDAGADKKAADSKGSLAESYLKDNKLLSQADKEAIRAKLK